MTEEEESEEDIMTEVTLDDIREGRYWVECSHCYTRIDEDMVDFDEDLIDEEFTDGIRQLHPCSLLTGEFFCCPDCREKWQAEYIKKLTLMQEQVRIIRKIFGDSAEIKIKFVGWRSGFCRCDRSKYEFPGSVDMKIEGLHYGVSGCALCRSWGVATGDIESGRWDALCERFGIRTKT